MLARVAQQDRKLPGFRAQQWYFFFVATFYLYFRCGHCSQPGGQGACQQRQQQFNSKTQEHHDTDC